jgi:hypothetical protein
VRQAASGHKINPSPLRGSQCDWDCMNFRSPSVKKSKEPPKRLSQVGNVRAQLSFPTRSEYDIFSANLELSRWFGGHGGLKTGVYDGGISTRNGYIHTTRGFGASSARTLCQNVFRETSSRQRECWRRCRGIEKNDDLSFAAAKLSRCPCRSIFPLSTELLLGV